MGFFKNLRRGDKGCEQFGQAKRFEAYRGFALDLREGRELLPPCPPNTIGGVHGSSHRAELGLVEGNTTAARRCPLTKLQDHEDLFWYVKL